MNVVTITLEIADFDVARDQVASKTLEAVREAFSEQTRVHIVRTYGD